MHECIIETKRLYLRKMNPNDYDALYRVLADPEIMQHYPYAFDEERVSGWIERNMERYRDDGFGLGLCQHRLSCTVFILQIYKHRLIQDCRVHRYAFTEGIPGS